MDLPSPSRLWMMRRSMRGAALSRWLVVVASSKAMALSVSFGAALWGSTGLAASPRFESPESVFLGDALAKASIELARERGARGLSLSAVIEPARSNPGLRLVKVRASACGIEFMRPVMRAIVDTREGGRVHLVSTTAAPDQPSCVVPRLDESTALAIVEASSAPGSTGAVEAVPLWRADGRLVWRVDPPPDLRVPTNPVFLVEDETGEVWRHHDRVRRAKVRAWSQNPVTTPQAEVEELIEIDDPAMHLEGPRFAAANCIEPDSGEGWCFRERTATPDMAGDFLYDAPDPDGPQDPQDSFAEASAYYHLDKFHAWLRGQGFDQLACHEEGKLVEVVVNRRSYEGGEWEPSDNAFYNGSCDASTLFMGQGAHDFAYDGDIIYHELVHGVTERLAGEDFGTERRRDDALVFDSSAIDEGVSDFLAAAFSGDPVVAEYAFPSGGRGLDHDFRCPRDLSGQAHADGQIIGGALWAAHEAVGDELVPVLLDALAMVDPDASFEELADVLLSLAQAAPDSKIEDALTEAFESRGLLDCSRVVPFEDFGAGGVHEDLGLAKLLHVRSPRMGNIYSPAPAPPLQWSVQMPDDADTATLSFAFFTEYSVPQNLALGIKHGGPISFDYVVEGKNIEVVADTDEVLFGPDEGEVAFSATPGSQVHIALLHTGTGDPVTDRWLLLHDFELEFSCAADECTPPDDEGGTGETGGAAEGGGSGCGCSAAAGTAKATKLEAFFLLLFLLPLRRRR